MLLKDARSTECQFTEIYLFTVGRDRLLKTNELTLKLFRLLMSAARLATS